MSRRHTIWPSDCRSDVCSSDLQEVEDHPTVTQKIRKANNYTKYSFQSFRQSRQISGTLSRSNKTAPRSEERRVGRESRSDRERCIRKSLKNLLVEVTNHNNKYK